MYEKRDAAAEAYALHSRSTSSREVGLECAAFNAGWEARKRAEYEGIIERAKRVPTRHILVLADAAIEALKK